MSDDNHWAGWSLAENRLLGKPVIRLTPGEAAVMRALIKAAGRYVDARTLALRVSRKGSTGNVRRIVTSLRKVLGYAAISTLRGKNINLQYALAPRWSGNRADDRIDFVGNLVTNLEAALAAAKLLRKSINEGN